jgi:hypothetical protein
MAIKRETGEILQRRHRYGSFAERYPDYPQWLDGGTWELSFDEDIKAPLAGFRSALHYQARCLGLNLVTKTVNSVDSEGRLVKVLLVQAQGD